MGVVIEWKSHQLQPLAMSWTMLLTEETEPLDLWINQKPLEDDRRSIVSGSHVRPVWFQTGSVKATCVGSSTILARVWPWRGPCLGPWTHVKPHPLYYFNGCQICGSTFGGPSHQQLAEKTGVAARGGTYFASLRMMRKGICFRSGLGITLICLVVHSPHSFFVGILYYIYIFTYLIAYYRSPHLVGPYALILGSANRYVVVNNKPCMYRVLPAQDCTGYGKGKTATPQPPSEPLWFAFGKIARHSSDFLGRCQ